MTPTVSVVMTTYQGARFVEPQVASIIAQTERPDDVIISDDGSTDGTADRARNLLEAADIAVEVIEGGPHPLGVVANLQRGLERARGDIVLLADQDDRWRPHRVAHARGVLDGHPHCDGLVANGHIIDATGHLLGGCIWTRGRHRRRRVDAILSDPLVETLRDNFSCGATMAVRRSAIPDLIPLDQHGLHDAWIAVVLAARDRLAVADEKVIDYRIHESNAVGLDRQPLAHRRRRTDVRARRIASLRAARHRVGELGAPRAALEAIDEQIAAEERRRSVPFARVPRALAVTLGVVDGSYHRYANGWRSAALDLVHGPE